MGLFVPSTINGWIDAATGTVADEPDRGIEADDGANPTSKGFHYDDNSDLEPGVCPLGTGDPSFRFFAGRLGSLESVLLLGEKSHRSFLLRVDGGEGGGGILITVSYVAEDDTKVSLEHLQPRRVCLTCSPPSFFTQWLVLCVVCCVLCVVCCVLCVVCCVLCVVWLCVVCCGCAPPSPSHDARAISLAQTACATPRCQQAKLPRPP